MMEEYPEIKGEFLQAGKLKKDFEMCPRRSLLTTLLWTIEICEMFASKLKIIMKIRGHNFRMQ